MQYDSFLGVGPTYDAFLDFGYVSLSFWPLRCNIRHGGLKKPMLFDVSNGRQNRADD
jgi:hypothetical protein